MVNYFGRSVNKVVIPEYGKNAVMKSVRSAQQLLDNKEVAQRNTALDFYYNRNMDKPIEMWFKGKNLSQVPPYTQRLVPRFAKARLMLYRKPSIKLFDGQENDTYNKAAYNLDAMTREFAELTWLLGDNALRTRWSERYQRLEYDIMPVCKKYHIGDESTPYGLSYEVSRGSNDKRRFVFWSEARDGEPGMHFEFDQSGNVSPVGDNDEMINIYNILPFSFAKYPSNSLDVVRSAEQIGIMSTEVALGIRFALGQPVLIGAYDDKSILAGIDNLITLPEVGSSFQYVSPTGSIPAMVQAIKDLLDITSSNHSLKIRWGDAGSVPSGIALTIMDSENLESRESDIPIWREWEKNRYAVDRVVYETHTGSSLPENVTIDFSEITYPMSPEQERAWLDWKLEKGIMSQRDLLLYFNPDMTDEELDSKLNEVQEEKAAIVPEPITPPLFEGLNRLGAVGT